MQENGQIKLHHLDQVCIRNREKIMIKVTFEEPSKDQPIKTIYFSNEKGICFRVAHFLDKKLVLDEMTEFENDKQIVSETLFNENYEVIAYRKFLKDSNNNYYGTEDYSVVNGHPKKLNSILLEYISQKEHHTKNKWFNSSGEYVYHTELGDQQEFRYVKPNGQIIDYDDLYDFLSTHKPLDFYEIRNQYLNQIVEENS